MPFQVICTNCGLRYDAFKQPHQDFLPEIPPGETYALTLPGCPVCRYVMLHRSRKAVARDLGIFPCHELPREKWCDHSGGGGFMGHTCDMGRGKHAFGDWRGS